MPSQTTTLSGVKRIRFSDVDQVLLIPSVSDYIQDGVHGMIWNSKAELLHIQISAFDEIKQFMQANNCTDAKKAARLMFATEGRHSMMEP